MILSGKTIKGTKILKETLVEETDENLTFRDTLEECLVKLCRELDIPVPLWLKKNTTEFARYRRTFFTDEQFVEKVSFDKFEIKSL